MAVVSVSANLPLAYNGLATEVRSRVWDRVADGGKDPTYNACFTLRGVSVIDMDSMAQSIPKLELIGCKVITHRAARLLGSQSRDRVWLLKDVRSLAEFLSFQQLAASKGKKFMNRAFSNVILTRSGDPTLAVVPLRLRFVETAIGSGVVRTRLEVRLVPTVRKCLIGLL